MSEEEISKAIANIRSQKVTIPDSFNKILSLLGEMIDVGGALLELSKRIDSGEFFRLLEKHFAIEGELNFSVAAAQVAINEGLKESYGLGIIRGLLAAERIDLLEKFPEVEKFAAILMAEREMNRPRDLPDNI